ncbi:hypothetical protein [Neobacillus drentensis]|uniref:hypothetical protein n=1 Tax=Neobacillus drentensis TaxID=220684 RepID=UPI002FFDF592
MAYIEELIDQISDNALRKKLYKTVIDLKKKKQFGLLYEEHVPEVVPIFNAPIRVKSKVAKKKN